MSTPEPTPLAQRLRDMAGKLAFDEVRKWHVPEANRYGGVVHPMGPTEKDVGRAIVPALLREIAKGASADMQRQLRELAWEIEALPNVPVADSIDHRQEGTP